MTVLVTGASGNVGRHVVSRLLGAGADVRVLTRRPDAVALPPGVRVVEGDLARPGSLPAALAGVRTMLLFPVAETADEVAALAARAGVRRIVVLSSAAVTAGYDTDFHRPVEQAVERSGLEWTHVRPGEFALNSLHLWGPSIRDGCRVVDADPDAPGTPVHEADIADVVTAALLADRHAGRAYDLAGPQTLTVRDRVAAIAAAIGAPVRLDHVDPATARAHYRAQGGWAADNADFLLGFEDYSGASPDPDAPVEPAEPAADGGPEGAGTEGAGTEGATAPGSADHPDAEWQEPYIPWLTSADITGKPARSYAVWARDHAADFR